MAEHYQLKCRECGKLWGNQARSFCDECLSPLEVVYDLEAIRPLFTRKNIEAGPTNLWRYSALLPSRRIIKAPCPRDSRRWSKRAAWARSSTR